MVKESEHARIAEVCLTYLCDEEMKQPKFRRIRSTAHRSLKRSPLAAYTIVHFSDNLSRASRSHGKHSIALNTFIMKYSYLDRGRCENQDLSPLIQTAKNIYIYLERGAKHHSRSSVEVQNISKWANDLIYLVTQFVRALIASPQAIMHIIPATCAQNSIIFRFFKSHHLGLNIVGLCRKEWDEKLCCIAIPEEKILSIACQDNIFALGTSTGKIILYQETTFQEIGRFAHDEPVHRLCFATTNDLLMSAGWRKISLWYTSTNQLSWSIPTIDEAFGFESDENDKVIYAATKANYIMIIDVHVGLIVERFRFSDWDRAERREFKYHRPPTHGGFSVGLGLLGVAYPGRSISFWDLEEHEFVGHFSRSEEAIYPEAPIQAFIFNPDLDMNLASVSYHDGTTYTFEPMADKTQAMDDPIASVVAASPDGSVLVTGSGHGLIKIYDFKTMNLLHQIFQHQQAIGAIAFNSNGNRFFEIKGSYCNIWEPSVLVRRSKSGEGTSLESSDHVPPLPDVNNAESDNEEETISFLAAHHESENVFCERENGAVAAHTTKPRKVAQELYV